VEVELKAEGFKELMEGLDTLCTPNIQKKLLQNSLKEAARPVKAEAERRLGRGKGYIGTGIPKRWGWGADTIASIGIGLKKKHWQLVFTEYGTVERFLTGYKAYRELARSLGDTRAVRAYAATRLLRKGARRGKIIAKPFVRPALDSQKQNALDRMRQYLELCLKTLFEQKQKMIPNVKEVD